MKKHVENHRALNWIERIRLARIIFVEYCNQAVKSLVFERVILGVIVLNSIYLAIDDN